MPGSILLLTRGAQPRAPSCTLAAFLLAAVLLLLLGAGECFESFLLFIDFCEARRVH